MSELARLRLAELFADLLPLLPPHERAEATRLLGPPPPPWPYDSAPVTDPRGREEWPCAQRSDATTPRTADAFPLAHLNATDPFARF